MPALGKLSEGPAHQTEPGAAVPWGAEIQGALSTPAFSFCNDEWSKEEREWRKQGVGRGEI